MDKFGEIELSVGETSLGSEYDVVDGAYCRAKVGRLGMEESLSLRGREYE